MKYIYTLLALLPFMANAQTVNFADPDLKAALLAEYDLNSDGEIQTAEAEAFTQLSISGSEIDDLTGLEAFTAVTHFYCTFTSITTLNLNWFPNLIDTNCGANPELTTVDLTGLVNLEHLELELAPISTFIGLQTATNIRYLDISESVVTTIDLSGLVNLRKFIQLGSQATAIVFPEPNQIVEFYLSGYLANALDLTPLHRVPDLPGDGDHLIQISHCPNLQYVNMKNGQSPQAFLFPSCPNLEYICADEDVVNDYFEYYLEQGIVIGSYCSFTSGGNFNTVTGTISFDGDANGCDASDQRLAYRQIQIAEGENIRYIYTDIDGRYTYYSLAPTVTVTPVFDETLFDQTPVSATADFSTANELTQDFCITPNGVHNDLEVGIIPTGSARPGFDAHYLITYKNKGNQSLSGAVSLAFNDAILDLVTASPATTAQATNQLTWDFAGLSPFETASIAVTMNVNSPVEEPPVNNGDYLSYTASIVPNNNDETPQDNQQILEQLVVGSYDPNDKTCLEGETITPEMAGDYLHYLIRFQNSGTFYAENVVVTDIIDTDKFDIGTLQLTGSSHPHQTRIGGNKVEFIFEGINLPAEQDDEPASHGYVAFKIKTKPTLVLDDVIQNTADIYFDFNAPITTNTTSTTVSLLGLGNVAAANVLIAPNPVKNTLAISARETITSVQLFDLQGRLLQTVEENDATSTIDFTGKARGVYIVKIATEKGMKIEKIIKE